MYEKNKFDCLVKMAMWDCASQDAAQFRSIDTSGVVVRKRLDRKIAALIRRQARRSASNRTKLVMSRVAVAIMLIVTIVFITMMSISAIREAIWRSIVNWYGSYITVQYQTPATETEPVATTTAPPETEAPTTEMTQAAVVVPPEEILEIRKPTDLPDGTVEDLLGVTKWEVCTDFYVDDQLYISFEQMVITKYDQYYDNEVTTAEKIVIKENAAMFVFYEESADKVIIWRDDEYGYILSSVHLDKEQMIQIAESVK